MTRLGSRGTKMLRRFLPAAVVVVIALTVGASLLGSTSGHEAEFGFQEYWPQPSTYTPGTNPPTAFLQINYTGADRGSYTYRITYNSTSGEVTVAQGSALVSKMASFRAYVYIPVPQGTVVVAQAVVYEGSAPNVVVYSGELVI